MRDVITREGVIPGQARVAAKLFAGNRVLQIARLHPHSSAAVFAAFRARRLAEGSDVFAALSAGCDLTAAVARAPLH